MHDCVSGLVSQHTEVSFCTKQCVKDRVKRKGNKGTSVCFRQCVCVRVCVHYYPLLLIVGLHHSKQSCSTEGTDAGGTVGSGTRQTQGRKFS